MKITFLLGTHSLPIFASNIGLAMLLGGWAVSSPAAQNGGRFSVAINLQTNGIPVGTAPAIGGTPAAPATVLCRSSSGIGTFGSALTVVCATGSPATFAGDASRLPWTPVPNGSYHYLFNVYRMGEQLGTVDSYISAGALSSWRRINLNNRDYLELMLHW